MTVTTEQFVRYGPDIERADPNFDQNLQTVVEAAKRYVAGSTKVEGRAVRDAHATGFGLARGEVEILGGLPTAYAQGIYATPGRHEAMVRFSSGSAHTCPDALLGPVCGMGLKLFGVAGPTLLEDEPDSGTFDYANINAPIFFANTIEQYVVLQQLFFQIGVAPPAGETRDEKRARLPRFLYTWVTGGGTLTTPRSSVTAGSNSSGAHGRTEKASRGQSVSARISAIRSAPMGVFDAGFRTNGQPTAIAGATLCATRLSGKLNGVIAATTPTGTRR